MLVAPAPGRRRDAVGPLLAGPLLGIVGPLVVAPSLIAAVAVPVTVARHRPARLAAEDAARIADGLEWLLGAYAWAALLVAPPPWAGPPRPVRLAWAAPPTPRTGRAALARIPAGLAGALALVALGLLALAPWLAAAASLLIARRVPPALRRPAAAVLARHARVLRRLAGLSPA